MLYILFGEQSYSIQKSIKKIAKNFLETIDEMNFVRLDASEVSFIEMLDEISSSPLGYDKKVVSIENCSFLAKETKSLREDKDYKELLALLRHNDEDKVIIFSIYEKAIDTKGELYKIVNESGKVMSLESVSEGKWKEYVQAYIDKYNINIDVDALNELAKRTEADFALFRNTMDKLTLYTDHITYNDINLMVLKPLEENVFLIYNSLINKKSDDAIKIYRDLVAQNVEPITIVSTLAKQFRLLHEVKYLTKQRMKNTEVASLLNIKDTRASILMRQSYNIDDIKIQNTLEELYQLDLQIKSGQVDRYYAFELFLIKFNK